MTGKSGVSMGGRKRYFIYVTTLIVLGVVISLVYHATQQASINYYAGKRSFRSGDCRSAILFYQKALKYDANYQNAIVDIAYCYQWTRQYPLAVEAFLRAISADPADNSLKISLAEIYSWTGEEDKAVALYREVLRTTFSRRVLIKLAEVYIWGKKYDKAKGILESITAKDPSNLEAKLLLAKALQFSGDTDKAIRHYQELLKEFKEK